MSLTPDVESIGYIVVVTAWVCPAITLPIFGLRLYAALRVLKRWHCDDSMIVLAVILALSNSVVGSIQVHNGLGNHIADVPLETLTKYLKLNLTGSMPTYNLTTMCTKASILLYYLRFPSSRAFRLATCSVLIISVGYTLTGIFAWAYNCTPMEKAWDRTVEGTCIDTLSGMLVRTIFNVATDVSILLLPIWLLWPLRLWSVWHKLSVLVVLMAGGFVCIASILRLVAFWTDRGPTEEDHTWHYVKNSSWCLLEVWVGVFCACLPSLKCLFMHYFPGLFSVNRDRRSLPSIMRIPVTDHDDQNERTEAATPIVWQLASRIRKKPSCGSSEPDLEGQGAVRMEDQGLSKSIGGQGEKRQQQNIEGTGTLAQVDPASKNPD